MGQSEEPAPEEKAAVGIKTSPEGHGNSVLPHQTQSLQSGPEQRHTEAWWPSPPTSLDVAGLTEKAKNKKKVKTG